MTGHASSSVSAARTPWYRQRWPWLLMLGPASVVVAGFATLYLALRSDDGLVADDYYRRGLAINQTLDRSARGAALDLRAVVDLDADGRVRATLRSRETLPPIVRLRLMHPTRAGLDQAADLTLGPDGRYGGRIDAPTRGRRLVVIETRDWRLGPVEADGDATPVTLQASAR